MQIKGFAVFYFTLGLPNLNKKATESKFWLVVVK